MKKIFSTLMAVALAAFTFTSCEDVPMPYDYPGTGGGEETPTIEPEGDGTVASPYNIAALNDYASSLEAGQTSPDQKYFKGKVVSIKEAPGNSFGNATFYLSDDGSTKNQFYVYRCYGPGNKKFSTSDEGIFGIGDELIVCGTITNYNGTLETEQNKAYVVSINGQGGIDNPGTSVDPKGTGTAADPFNVAAANKICESLEKSSTSASYLSDEVYVAGKISSITDETLSSFGNITYYISDDGTTANQLEVYRGFSFNGDKFKSLNDIKVGDEVVICGKLQNWLGTFEFTQGSKLVSVNGVGGGDTPVTPDEPSNEEAKGDGTLENPFNAVAANNYAKNGGSESEFKYVKGKVSNVKSIDVSKYERAQYYISEDGTTSSEQFYIYNGYYLDKKAFTSNDQIKVGDEVIVYGKIVTYNGSTIEMAADNYIVSHNSNTGNGGTGEEVNPGTGDNDNDVLTVAQAIANNSGKAWVEGYIVGWIDGKTLSSGAKFNDDATVNTNLLIADSANETNVSNCIPVQLPSGDVRNALNLQDNKSNYGKKVKLYGSLEKYFGAPGLKSVTKYEFAENSSAKAKRVRK